ncbi:19428_t:CDS:2, partial [Gigaspora margarita]
RTATPTDSNDEITPGRKTATPTRTHIGRDVNSNDEPYSGRKEALEYQKKKKKQHADLNKLTPTPTTVTTPTNCKKEELVSED